MDDEDTHSLFLTNTHQLFGYYPSPFRSGGGGLFTFQSIYNDQDLAQDPGHELPNMPLPMELVDLILLYLFHSYLSAHCFAWALVILELRPSVARLAYRHYVNALLPDARPTMYRHLSRTFLLLNTIYDEYLTERYSQSTYPCIRFYHPEVFLNNLTLAPYTFAHRHYVTFSLDYVTHPHPLYRLFTSVRITNSTPLYNTDIAFLDFPHALKDVYSLNHLMYPLIWFTIDLTLNPFLFDPEEYTTFTTHPTYHTFFTSDGWNRFLRLCLFVFGRHTALIFTYEDEEGLTHYYLKRSDSFPLEMVTTESGTFQPLADP